MRNLIASLSVLVSFSCFAQVAPTASNDVLAYDVFNAKQGFLQTEITFEPNKEQRVLKLSIENNGDRKYDFLNDRPFAVYDKSFTRTSNRGVAVSLSDYFVVLPKNQKVEVGAQWEFSRSGYGDNCGNWSAIHRSTAKEGPETLVTVNGKSTSVKTLLIEQSGTVTRSNGCSQLKIEGLVLYAPELNEVLMNQSVDTVNQKFLAGYKWVLKTITTNAGK
jgi:hypothetical protein